MTMATDFALAVLTFSLAYQLYSNEHIHNSKYVTSFLLFTLASTTGGTYHGFILVYPALVMNTLWKITLYAYGTGTLALVLGVLENYPSQPFGEKLQIMVYGKYVVFCIVALFTNDFNLVAIDIVLTIVLVLGIILSSSTGFQEIRWYVYALISLLFVGIIWYFEIAFHTHFNHNDFAHVVLMTTMFFFYKGFIRSD